MNIFTPADIFFVISSVGFVILWILVAIFLVYLIKITHSFSKIMKQVEKDVDEIGDTTKEILYQIEDSALFQFLFGKKRRGRKETK